MEPVKGSFYQMFENRAKCRIGKSGDWVWLRNGLTKEEVKASELLALVNRYVVKLVLKIQFQLVFTLTDYPLLCQHKDSDKETSYT